MEMRCDKVEAAVQEALETSAEVSSEVRRHCEACAACGELVAGLLQVDQVLRHLPDVPAMPDTLVAHVMAGVVTPRTRSGELAAAFIMLLVGLVGVGTWVAPQVPWQPWGTALLDYFTSVGAGFEAFVAPAAAVWNDFWYGSWGAASVSNGLAVTALLATVAMLAYLNVRWARVQPS